MARSHPTPPSIAGPQVVAAVLHVLDYVRDNEASDPKDAESLAGAVASRVTVGEVDLDFSGVRVMNSAFSNAFFLTLWDVGVSPNDIVNRVRIRNASSLQGRLFSLSRAAVVQRVQEERDRAKAAGS